jgi:hypothetical protein
VLVGTEIPGGVVERGLHPFHHALDVEGVRRVVIDVDVDVLPPVVADGVASREDGEELQHRTAAPVEERPAAVLAPRPNQVSRGDGDLVWRCRYRGLESHPVRAERVALRAARVVQVTHPFLGLEPIFLPGCVIGELEVV